MRMWPKVPVFWCHIKGSGIALNEFNTRGQICKSVLVVGLALSGTPFCVKHN